MLDVAHATAFAVMLGALWAAHDVADHWVQTSYEAGKKGEKSAEGRAACLSHVLSYTFVTVLFAGGLALLFNLRISLIGFLAGQIISAVTHYWADRRFTLEKLAGHLNLAGLYNLGKPRDLVILTDNTDSDTVSYYTRIDREAVSPITQP